MGHLLAAYECSVGKMGGGGGVRGVGYQDSHGEREIPPKFPQPQTLSPNP